MSLTNVPVVSESKTHATVDRNTPNDTTDTLPPKYTCNLKPMTCDVSTEAAATSVNVQSEQCASPAKSAQTSAVGDSVEKEAEVIAATQGAIDERSSGAGDLICEACGCTVTFETHPTYSAKHNCENSRLVIYCSRQCRSTYEVNRKRFHIKNFKLRMCRISCLIKGIMKMYGIGFLFFFLRRFGKI